MIHSYKYIVCATLVGASFGACCFQPIQTKAVDVSVGEQAGIYDYLDAGNTALFNIDFQLNEDSDGNRSKRLQIYALQSAMLSTQTQIYDNMDFSIAPSYVTVSGSSSSGLYRSYIDNEVHAVTLLTGGNSITSPVASSDEFSLHFVIDSPTDIIGYVSSTFSGIDVNYSCIYTRPSATTFTITFPTDSYFTSGYSATYSFGAGTSSSNIRLGVSSPDIPALSATFPWSNYVGKTLRATIGGYGVSVSLPESMVDTDKPWDYYNNVLLPYIENQFPDVPDLPDFLIFPDGYQEPVQSTTIPVVYPTAPSFDFGLVEDGTQPEGIETAAYELPEIETKSIGIPVFDLQSLNPAQIVAPVSNGLSGIWALITDVLQSFGLFPLVTLALLVSVIGALLLLGR